MEQVQQTPQKLRTADVFGLLNLLATCHATMITPVIRRGFGTEAFNPFGLIALVALLMLTEGRWTSAVGVYTAVWFVSLIVCRIESLRLRSRGIVAHSQYMGYPWLVMKIRP